jgi:hypothetical protein
MMTLRLDDIRTSYDFVNFELTFFTFNLQATIDDDARVSVGSLQEVSTTFNLQEAAMNLPAQML